jgi:hypothetical protein
VGLVGLPEADTVVFGVHCEMFSMEKEDVHSLQLYMAPLSKLSRRFMPQHAFCTGQGQAPTLSARNEVILTTFSPIFTMF